MSAKAIILQRHQTSRHELDARSLPIDERPPAWGFQELATDARETFGLPSVPQVQDGYQYSVALDKSANQYWIIRSGGYAGRFIAYGPGTIVSP